MEKEEKIAAANRNRNKLIVGVLALAVLAGAVIYKMGATSHPTLVKKHQDHKQHHSQPHRQHHYGTINHEETEEKLVEKIQKLDQAVRDIKATGVIMEVDEEALEASDHLQGATRKLLLKRYGKHGPYRVRVNLEFQPTIPDYEEMGPDGTLVLEMAPIDLVPHSVYTFMEIARHWTGGAFHRNAGHVLQVMVQNPPVKHLAFQEYSEFFPHKLGTVGYAGRPSGPGWYVSIMDNTKAHGRGTQQDKNPHEADSCFGKVVEGFDDVVPRIKKMGGAENMGFVHDEKQHVLIKSMQILVPDGEGGYTEWISP